MATNFRSDITWYLLGRAADGLGNPRGAVTYYTSAKSELNDAHSCSATGLCKGIDLGGAIDRDLAQAQLKGGMKATVSRGSR